MLVPNRCKKCGGANHTRSGLYGVETNCLNCGYEEQKVPQAILDEISKKTKAPNFGTARLPTTNSS